LTVNSPQLFLSNFHSDGGNEHLISNDGRFKSANAEIDKKQTKICIDGDGGHEQLISNGGRFKPAYAESDKKQQDRSSSNPGKLV
jgi:hypothetical protein